MVTRASLSEQHYRKQSVLLSAIRREVVNVKTTVTRSASAAYTPEFASHRGLLDASSVELRKALVALTNAQVLLMKLERIGQ